jgi:plastocyanin
MPRERRRRVQAIALAGALFLAAGCGPVNGAGPAATPQLELRITTGTGERLTFEPPVTVVPADTPVQISLVNASGQPHNLTFQAPIAGATRTIVEAGSMDTFVIRTPGPGRYTFVCTIHVDMRAALEVR